MNPDICSSVADASVGIKKPVQHYPAIIAVAFVHLPLPVSLQCRGFSSCCSSAFLGLWLRVQDTIRLLFASLRLAFPTMSPTSISADAFTKMKDLSKWVSETTEVVQEQNNLFRCVDEARHAKVNPLLEKLGFDKIKVSRLPAD